MRRLFLTILLWFWLTLVAVAVVQLAVVARTGIRHSLLFRLTLHDLLLFSIAGAIFCWLVSRYLTTPLEKLRQAAAGIAEGRLDTRTDASLRNRRDEISTLARDFDRMAEQIESLVMGQRRLLGDVSHELRSPLARLTVALGLVNQGPAEEAAEHLERIRLEARRLDKLIGQLLILSRIDSGLDRGAPARFDLAEVLQEVANDADFEAKTQNRSVVVTRADACPIDGFEEMLRSAVENVMRNAVRYTSAGTMVEISLQTMDSRARLHIRDYGPGVPDAMMAAIFRPFHRLSDNSPDGAGLGLAIAERAVRAHQGSIRAMSAPGAGLIVEIDLPLGGTL